jgi:P4 family phage/plasmid primase-like protien
LSLIPNDNNYNEWLDNYFYNIGINVIPANSKEKRPIIPFKQYLNNAIPSDVFKIWKNENKFKDGFIIILGKIWRGINEGKYLIGIDIDKELGIKEFCTRNCKTITLSEFGHKTVVEQHTDDLTKAHVYFISPIPFPLKSSDTLIGIEVKKYMVPAPNTHKNGNLYEIIGNSKEPLELNQKQALELIRHIDTICRKYGLKYLDFQNHKRSSEIRKMIKSLSINPELVIEEGERHTILLSIADSLLIKHFKLKNGKEDEKSIQTQKLKDFFVEINNQLCKPFPLPEKEMNEIWNSAINYVINLKNRQSSYKEEEKNLVEKATEYLLSKYHFLTSENSQEILYYENGVYQRGGEIIIEKELENEYSYELKTSIIYEVKGHIKRHTFVKPEEFDRDHNIINLKNGLYHIKENKLESHSPDYYSITQKSFGHNSKAKSQLLGKFLREVLFPNDIRTAVELMAYTFVRDNPYELLCILIGNGSNGKNVFTGVLTNLHGNKNVSNVPLKKMIGNRFALADLENKDVNIDTELSTEIITDISILKKLTGKQPIRIERKNKDAYDVLLHAKLFFSANKTPLILDDSDARFRREIYLTFPYQFEEGKNADPRLLEKLITEDELSGIFNSIMVALRRIQKNDKIYLNQKSIQERRERHELIKDPIFSFTKVAVVEGPIPSNYVTKEDLYNAYLIFSKFHNLPFKSKEEFGKILKKQPYNLEDGRESKNGKNRKRSNIWKGIKLNKWWNVDSKQDILTLENLSN